MSLTVCSSGRGHFLFFCGLCCVCENTHTYTAASLFVTGGLALHSGLFQRWHKNNKINNLHLQNNTVINNATDLPFHIPAGLCRRVLENFAVQDEYPSTSLILF